MVGLSSVFTNPSEEKKGKNKRKKGCSRLQRAKTRGSGRVGSGRIGSGRVRSGQGYTREILKVSHTSRDHNHDLSNYR